MVGTTLRETRVCIVCHTRFLPNASNQRHCHSCQRVRKAKKPEDAPPDSPNKQLLGAKIRARAFDKLRQYIQANQGWIVSVPGASPLVWEAVDSTIADNLVAAGHKVTQVGNSERLTGNAGFVKSRNQTWHYAGIAP